MKQIFITLLALIGISMNAHATAQASDIIYINGEKWKLRGKPIRFDENLHEAITRIPAVEESQKGTVVDVVENGYYLNDKVLRYAKVVVAF